MILKADFRCKQVTPEADDCVVEKVVELPTVEYDRFCRSMLERYPFIGEVAASLHYNDGMRHGFLVLGVGRNDGILVDPQGADYARYSAFIFYSDSRLKLHLESDQMYHLTVNGKDVLPDKISCGERNALALCYFFSEIAKETELQKLYRDEMLVVIDDPVSSFDIENRVGILSFLRYKLNQMLFSCATTKVLIMSHDVSAIFDLQKTMDEVSANCAGAGKHAEYCSFQLVNRARTGRGCGGHLGLSENRGRRN